MERHQFKCCLGVCANTVTRVLIKLRMEIIVTKHETSRKKSSMTARGRRVANKMLAVQLIASLALTIAFYFYSGWLSAYSAFIGLVIGTVPNLYFSTKVFAESGARRAHQLLRSFYVGQTIKTFLTIGLFVMSYLFLDVEPAPMLVVFIVGLLVHRLAPIVMSDS